MSNAEDTNQPKKEEEADTSTKEKNEANLDKKITNFLDNDYVRFFFTTFLFGTLITGCLTWRNQEAEKLKYEQGLVNTYIEDVKGLLLKEYRSKDSDPEITHVEIANFVSSKTSSLLKTITDAEQRQRLINFLKYSSIATIPSYRYPLYFPDNICSRVSTVKSKYYVDFLCTLDLTSDQKIIVNNEKKNDNKYNLECEVRDKENRINLSNVSMADMVLENVDFRRTILENALFDRAQLDNASFDSTFLDNSSFNNTDLQYADMNCAQLRKAVFSNSFMKKAIFSNSDLSEAKLKGSDLRDAELYNANLSFASLGVNTGFPTRNITDLRGSNFEKADLTGAKLIKVDLRGVENLKTIKYNNNFDWVSWRWSERYWTFLFTFTIRPIGFIKCENSIIDSVSFENLSADFKKYCLLKVIAPKENLEEANLSGFDLSGENLQGANLKGTDLRKTDLRGTNLTKIEFNEHTNFEDAIYDETSILPEKIEKSKLVKITHYPTASKEIPRQNADLTFVNLQYANLSNSNLTELKLAVSNLSYARLFGATLTKAILTNANLTRANLEDSVLTGATLRGANLIEANLRGATLTNADLQEALLIRTDLRGAKLSQAILERLPKLDDAIYNDKTQLPFSDKKAKDYGMWKIAPGSDLKGAILRGVDLRDANLCDAVIDDKTRLDGALFNENTRLPKKISPNDKCNLSPKDIMKAQDEYNMVFIPKNRADLRGANLCDTIINEQAVKAKWNKALFNEKTQLPKSISNLKCGDKNYKMTKDIIEKAKNKYNMVFCPSNDSKAKADDKDILTCQRANLQGANLLGVDFKDANLTGADLSGANLRGTYWKKGINLKGTKFTGADLRDATFQKGVDLGGVVLKDTDLRGTNLRGVNKLSSKQLKNICYDKRTQFPPRIKPTSKPDCEK